MANDAIGRLETLRDILRKLAERKPITRVGDDEIKALLGLIDDLEARVAVGYRGTLDAAITECEARDALMAGQHPEFRRGVASCVGRLRKMRDR